MSRPTPEELDEQADSIYDNIGTSIFREEWRKMYRTLVYSFPPKPPETEEQKANREFQESQQRAANMRREKNQRDLERDAEAHRARMRREGWYD